MRRKEATACRRTDRRTIVHLSGGLDMGGQEKLLVEFARHADRQRYALHFLSLGGRGPIAEEIEAEGWPVSTLEIPAGLKPGAVVRLARLLPTLKADVVHTHNDRPLIYGAPAGRLARVGGVVHTKHGRAPANSQRQRFLIRCAARLTDHFAAVSEDCRELAQAQGIASKRLLTIQNGIDTGRFAFHGPASHGPAVIVGRLNPEKDLANLLNAVALVVRQEPSFRLHIAGDGPCREALQQQVRDQQLEPYVTFLGTVQEIPALLRSARLYVLSSLSEGISLTLLEAQACGLPVVATRVGGTAEVIEDGANGLLVPSADAVALAEGLLTLWRDPVRATEMGRLGRERIERDFDIRQMVSRYEALYASMMEPRATKRRALAHV